jgi:hypothetical protein
MLAAYWESFPNGILSDYSRPAAESKKNCGKQARIVQSQIRRVGDE